MSIKIAFNIDILTSIIYNSIMKTPMFTDIVWNTSFVTNLKDYCDFVRKHNPTSRILTNEGGYQSDNLILTEPLLQPLIQFLTSETSKYSSYFHLKHNQFKVENMWININGYKDYNTEHTHFDHRALFSGVYYVQTPKNCGNIEFIKSNYHTMAVWAVNMRNDSNNFNSASWFLPAEQHKCYIFPSYYIHRVQPNLNPNEKRYSISFNLSLNP